MKYLTKLLVVFCLSGFAETIQAQSSFPATGGVASGSGGTLSYTIGQIVYTAIPGSGGRLVQGAQVNYEISSVTSVKDESELFIEMSVYPVPSNGFVTLKVGNYDTENLSYRLFDMNGIILQNNKVEGNETRIHMGNLLPGTYFLKIVDRVLELKTFRIIKK